MSYCLLDRWTQRQVYGTNTNKPVKYSVLAFAMAEMRRLNKKDHNRYFVLEDSSLPTQRRK